RQAVVAAVRREGRRVERARLAQLLQRIVHGRRSSPSVLNVPDGLRAASPSLFARYDMKRLPPRCLKPRSSTDSTRSVSETVARIGLRSASKASSAIEKEVIRTGKTRFLLHTNSVRGASIGTISSIPRA